MPIDANKIIKLGLAVGVFFVLTAYMIMTFFSSAYRFAQDTCWTNSTAACDYSTTVNTTPLLPASSKICSGTVQIQNSTGGTSWCEAVSTAGTYRSVNQGILLIVFVIAMIGFAIQFLKRR